jgi:ribonuclease Z
MPRLANILVEGVSVGGLETSIDCPEWKLAFDIGRCPDAAVNRPTILFTHAHMDHMGGVAWHAATRHLRRMGAPTYVVPRENEVAFRELFEVWRRLDRSELQHNLVALGPGEELELPNKLLVRPFRAYHRVPCQGYGIWSRRRKLKPQHVGKSDDELRELRELHGDEAFDMLEVAELAFTGDTLIEVVERTEVVRRARVLVMEVTFLDDTVSVAQCREKGHIHLDEVLERADLFENEALLFTHFSSRYSAARIVEILARRLPAGLRERVTPMLPPLG